MAGGPFGGAIGGLIGGAIGSRIDGTKKYHYEGARLEDLAVQTSTYGKAIPKVWGSVRLAGNVIWSRPIKEMVTKTTVSGGGKGGGGGRSKTTQSEYSYYITLAIAICEGEITRIDRVWADAKLLDLSQGTYRLYTGTETQLADTLIESFEGVGSTPAYRGMAYVVVEDFPLGDFGNRIPNFTFEVTRRTPQRDGDAPVESAVKSIMLIPGSGEFVYDTRANYKVNGDQVGSQWVQNGYQMPLNQHTADGKANVLVALDQMQQTFPNLEWVGVAINWFGTTMDIGSCEVWPCVEYKASAVTAPEVWSVAGHTRSSARLIGNDAGAIRYGGTPDDAGIVRLCEALRARGLKVFCYPMLLMDVAGKPWRGFLTGSTGNVSSFFSKAHGYKEFILHYANLLAGKIDAFAIGSELRDLTKITSAAGVFPAVGELVTLAEQVKTILGAGVKVTYAADWSEYHHTDGGWHHMDALWACPSIDAVGIDAYFPLTDAEQTGYDIEAIKAGWVSGEGYDWYYTDDSRTLQAPLGPEYAWKNIEYWWRNTHINPNGMATAWVPESKPVWFTEYGFASVDGCTNEPNVFVDATTGGSSFPRFSRGRVDFMAQRTAIAATESQWGDNSVVSRRFLWTWDARPYPYWPDLHSVWADGGSWVTGHWVQGKLGGSHVAAAVEEIAAAAGCDVSRIDTSAIQIVMDGFILNQRTSARAAIEQLMQAYFFQVKESDGKLVAMPRRSAIDHSMEAQECLPLVQDAREIAYQLQRTEDLLLPDKVEVQSLNRLQNYATHLQSAQRGTQDANEVTTLPLALVLSEAHGRALAQTVLADRWAERSSVTMQLPLKYAALEPGDIILLGDGGQTHRVRLQQVQLGKPGMVRVRGVIDASDVWDGYVPPTVGGSGAMLFPPAATELAILDLPAFPGDVQDALTLRLAVCGQSENWEGASILRVNTGGEEQLLAEVGAAAVMGSCTTVLASGLTQMADAANTLDVSLLGEGTLSSVTELAMLNGANTALVGSEIIQFSTAVLLSPGKYRLSMLLRGRLGTEYAVDTHAANERFVLLDGLVAPLVLPAAALGQSWTLRAVTGGTALAAGTEVTQTIVGNSLKPYAPVGVKAMIDGSNNVTFSWLRRARIDGGLRDLVDIPLMEQSEMYELVVYNGSTVVRSWQVTGPSQLYSAAQQISDFGSLQSSYAIKITQQSAIVGPGNSFLGTVAVQ
jgi:hypothetical protein